MIELDTEESRKRIIAVAGGRHIGERGGLVWFTDPMTKTTLICRPEDVSLEHIRRHLQKSRDSFGIYPEIHLDETRTKENTCLSTSQSTTS